MLKDNAPQNMLLEKLQQYIRAERYWTCGEYFCLACHATLGDADYSHIVSKYIVCIHCTSGFARLTINNKHIALSPRQILTLLPFQKCRLTESDGLFRFNIYVLDYESSISAEFGNEYWMMLKFMENPVIQLTEQSNRIVQTFFDSCKYVIGYKKETRQMELILLLIKAYYKIVTEHSIDDGTPYELYGIKYGSTTMNFYKLLTGNYTREHHIDYYAERMSISEKHLSMTVKKESGHTANWWITFFLIREATRMICDGQLNIKEICEKLHFENQRQFCKWFKRQKGMSPTEYRRASMKTGLSE